MVNAVYSLVAVLIVSSISLVGVLFLPLQKEDLKKIISFLVSFATGVLFGDVFLHLIPDIYERMGLEIKISLLILGGIFLFFTLEKMVKWHHCHDPECKEHSSSIATMNLIGDGLHNFLDGVLIAGSFLANFTVGITTTLAVLAHEIPQEIGDFGVLLHAGYSRKKALLYNFISALAALLGVLVVILVRIKIEDIYLYILPATAGGFLYIAGSDLLPELHKELHPSQALNQFLGIGLGILLMLAMLNL